MKTYLKVFFLTSVLCLGVVGIFTVALAAPTSTITQNLFIKDLSSTGLPCLKIGTTGLVATSTCGGSGGLATSSPFTTGLIPFVLNPNTITATTSFSIASSTGEITSLGRVVLGGTSIGDLLFNDGNLGTAQSEWLFDATRGYALFQDASQLFFATTTNRSFLGTYDYSETVGSLNAALTLSPDPTSGAFGLAVRDTLGTKNILTTSDTGAEVIGIASSTEQRTPSSTIDRLRSVEVYPNTDLSGNIGSSTRRWQEVFASALNAVSSSLSLTSATTTANAFDFLWNRGLATSSIADDAVHTRFRFTNAAGVTYTPLQFMFDTTNGVRSWALVNPNAGADGRIVVIAGGTNLSAAATAGFRCLGDSLSGTCDFFVGGEQGLVIRQGGKQVQLGTDFNLNSQSHFSFTATTRDVHYGSIQGGFQNNTGNTVGSNVVYSDQIIGTSVGSFRYRTFTSFNNNSSTAGMLPTWNGSVGIGSSGFTTTAPATTTSIGAHGWINNNSTNANQNGTHLYIHSGVGTGNHASSSDIAFFTPTANASGTTIQDLTERIRILGNTGWVGIGTSTPITTFHVVGSSTFAGHVNSTGTVPTVSTCGTTPSIVGTDTAGRVTIGSGALVTSCTITFAQNYKSPPVITGLTNETQLSVFGSTTSSTLTITSATSMDLDVVHFGIMGID